MGVIHYNSVFCTGNKQLPHDIRLAGPWEYSVSNDETWIRCHLPWQIPTNATEVAVRRKFHRPTGLTQASQLQLLIFADKPIASIRLNEADIQGTAESPWELAPKADETPADESAMTENRFDVSTTLKEFNTAELTMTRNGCSRIERAVLRILG